MVAPERWPTVAGGLLLSIVSDAIVVPVLAGLVGPAFDQGVSPSGIALTSAVVEVSAGG